MTKVILYSHFGYNFDSTREIKKFHAILMGVFLLETEIVRNVNFPVINLIPMVIIIFCVYRIKTNRLL